jgi:3-hydroxy-5-phosphonooxypentane-2,4-dione thiolase
VDMGRNIFQSEFPRAMIQAVRQVVHKHEKPEQAYDLYRTLAAQPAVPLSGNNSLPRRGKN